MFTLVKIKLSKMYLYVKLLVLRYRVIDRVLNCLCLIKVDNQNLIFNEIYPYYRKCPEEKIEFVLF